MAREDDIEADLTLELDGGDVTPERFQKAVRAFFGMLNEITRAVCEGSAQVQWRVQVKSGSNLVGVNPQPGFPSAVVGNIAKILHRGLAGLEHDGLEPRNFSEAAIRHARDLGDVMSGAVRDNLTVRIWERHNSIALTTRLAKATERYLTEAFEDHGSIDGKLQTLSERGAMRFVVYDTLTDRGIPCFIEPEQLAVAMQHFRARVEVYGIIRYRADGLPMNIRVEDIVPFPARSNIPSFRDMRGILRHQG